MKKLFIETKYIGKINLPKLIIKKLPSKLVLVMPVQFLDFLEEIKKQLKDKKIILFKSKHGQYPGQILGCDIHSFPGDYDAFFYIGDGKFHPTALLYENNKPVYCYNPFNNKLEILNKDYLERINKKKKGLILKFLSKKNVGLLITTKSGQSKVKLVEKLKEHLEKNGKNVFVFLADEINFSSLENFNFIDVWVNSACPRIVEDFKCLNIEDLIPFLSGW